MKSIGHDNKCGLSPNSNRELLMDLMRESNVIRLLKTPGCGVEKVLPELIQKEGKQVRWWL